jgi:hypothetical protein
MFLVIAPGADAVVAKAGNDAEAAEDEIFLDDRI